MTDTTSEPVAADEDYLTVDVCERMAVVWAKAASAFPLRGPRAAALEQVDEWQRAAAGPDRATADLTGWEAAEALRKAISFGAGKVTALRSLGLQPDEYCREEQDGMTVELPPRDHGKDVA